MSNTRLKFTVVTTCLNAESTVLETIESVLGQEGPFEIEYLVTDAGSTDATLSIIQRFGDRIQLISCPGANVSEGINIGFSRATGDVLVILNADDLFEPGCLRKVAQAFEQASEAKWLIGQCRIIDGRGMERDKWISRYKNFLLANFSYYLLLCENCISAPSVFLRRGLVDSVGLLNTAESLAQDYEYWLRIGPGYSPIILRENLSSFRRTPSTTSNRMFVRQFEENSRISAKYARRHNMRSAILLNRLLNLKTTLLYRLLYGSPTV